MRTNVRKYIAMFVLQGQYSAKSAGSQYAKVKKPVIFTGFFRYRVFLQSKVLQRVSRQLAAAEPLMSTLGAMHLYSLL